jgi:hypothetical protein
MLSLAAPLSRVRVEGQQQEESADHAALAGRNTLASTSQRETRTDEKASDTGSPSSEAYASSTCHQK